MDGGDLDDVGRWWACDVYRDVWIRVENGFVEDVFVRIDFCV